MSVAALRPWPFNQDTGAKLKSAVFTYGLTVAVVASAGVVRWLLSPALGDQLPYPPFFIAVAVAAWLGGLRAALLATSLGFLVVMFLFVPTGPSLLTMDSPDLLGLGMFLIVCLVFAGFGEAMRNSHSRLAENAERLRTTLASIGDAVITTDIEGRVTNLNATAELLTGWTNSEAVGQPLTSVFHIVNEVTRKSVENPALRALREHITVGLTNHTILIARNGAEFCIDDSAAPIRRGDGEVVGSVLIFRDIGEQRRLQRQAGVLASIVHNSDDAIISKSLNGIIQSWNAAAERLFGYPAEQAIGRHISLVIPPERAAEEDHILSQLRKGQRIEHFDTVRVRSNGDLIHVSLTISPVRDASGEIVGASKIVRDISERKLAEEALRESEARKSAMLQNALDCVISIDHDGKIVEFNPAAEQTFGYQRDVVLGQDLAELMIPTKFQGPHRQGITQYLATGISKILNQRLELTALRSDGSEFPVELAVTRISANGLPIFTAYLRDITDRKREENAQVERTRLVSLRADVSTALSSAEPTVATLQNCCDALVRHLDVASARIWTLDVTDTMLELQASAGLHTHRDRHHSRVPVGQSVVGRIASSRKSHLTSALASDPEVRDQQWVLESGMVAFAGYPLVVEDRVAGVIELFARQPWTGGMLTELAPLADSIAQFLDRRRAEAVFRQQAELTRTTLASIGDAVITTDVAGLITQLNSVAESLTGWTNQEAQGQVLETVFRIVNETTRQPVQSPALKALQDGVIVGLANHTVLIAKDGSERPIDDSAAPIHSEAGEIVGCVLVFRDITERKRAEQKVEEARSRLESTLIAGEIGTWEFDIASNCVRADQNLARFCGVTPDEAEGGPLELFTRAIHPDDRQRVTQSIDEAIDHGTGFESQYRLIAADGEIRWVVARGRVHRDANGRPLRLPGVVVDITRQKLVEDELRASEGRRRIALDSAELGAWNIDPATSLLISDERFQTIFTGTEGPLSFEEAFALIHVDDRERIRKAVEAATQPGDPVSYAQEYRVVHPDGTIRWVFAKGRANFDGDRLTSFDGTVLDITDRKRAEELIRQNEHRLRFIMDSMPQKVFTATAQGEMDYFNSVWMEFTGLSYEQIRDRGWMESIHPDDLADNMRAWKQSIQTGNEFLVEHRFLRADGAYRWHVSRAKALKDENGNVVMWVGANTDIHEQRQTADELREVAAKLSEADHRKDEFLATLAHELRNPLAPIRNGLQVMRLASDNFQLVEQSRMMMERQLDQMVRLVDDLMDVSRISRGKLDLKLQRVDLAAVVNSAIETSRPLLDQMGHELTVTLPEHPVFLDADLTRLAQVVLNLLNNAAKYSDRNGHIQLNATQQGNEIVVSVKDTGIGIAADQLPRIFEMFSQVDRSLEKSQGGLGIGLTLVRRLVEMHGGSVIAHSEGPGKGSEFVVRLPIVADASGLDPTNGNHLQSSPKSALRILIVDDNRDSATSLSMMFKLMGNETRTAYDGEEALVLADSLRPDVILLDIGLPKLNGYEACRRIREQSWGKEIVIIAQTGWGQDEDRQRTRDVGFNHHMVKPVDPMELMKLLAELSETGML